MQGWLVLVIQSGFDGKWATGLRNIWVYGVFAAAELFFQRLFAIWSKAAMGLRSCCGAR